MGGDWKRVSCHGNKMFYSRRCVLCRTISLPSFNGLRCNLAKIALFIYILSYGVECMTSSVFSFAYLIHFSIFHYHYHYHYHYHCHHHHRHLRRDRYPITVTVTVTVTVTIIVIAIIIVIETAIVIALVNIFITVLLLHMSGFIKTILKKWRRAQAFYFCRAIDCFQ